MENTLLFIYNANSGTLNGLIDLMHKSISPKTYPCDLCAITYDIKGMLPIWKKYINTLPYKILFLHKDELKKEYPFITAALPAILLLHNNTFQVLISSEDFKEIKSLDALIQKMEIALQSITPIPPSKS